mgnify:CR=1 FL=1
MGRGSGSALTADFAGRRGDEITLKPFTPPPDIGSEAHRLRLQSYARARTGRGEITVSLSQFCGRCKHDYDHHSNAYGCSECDCREYLPGGGSFTDMKGNITVQTDVPPGGTPEDRELCIAGLLRHELCHEERTDQATYFKFVEELKRMESEGKEITAAQLKKIHNILEDGMIEERERQEKPSSYSFISALNRLYPRVGGTTPAPEDLRFPAPDGYIPTDADGNELPIVTDPDGSKWVEVKKGTPLSPWGKRPLHPARQIEAALLATAIPEFEPGELHPDVQKALEECMPHIDAALSGNTADCVLRADAILQVLRKHGLMREDLTDEEREALEELARKMGEMQAESPDAPADQPQEQPSSAMNGVPMPGPPTPGAGDSQSALQPDFMKELAQPQGGDDEGGESGENGSQGSGSGSGSEQDQEGQGSGSGAGEEKKDGEEGQDSGSGKDGPKKGKQQGAGGGRQNDDQSGDSGSDSGQGEQQGGDPNSPGGDDGSGGYDPNRPLPKSLRDRNEKEGRGSVDADELERRRAEARQQINEDKARQSSQERRNIRQGKIEGDDWQLPSGESVYSQRELRQGAGPRTGYDADGLREEDGKLHTLGVQLGARLKRIKSEAIAPQRFKRRGKLDRRRYAAAMAGNPNVFYRPGQNLDLDLEIDVSIDRSGSVDADQTAQQYRMARMMAVASRETKVPMSIYGWDGGWGESCRHYAFKERHSNDMSSLKAIFQCGGGGTPTAEGVRFARARLRHSQAKQKVMVVITDGAAHDIAAAAEQVQRAKDQGIQVIGLAFYDERRGQGPDPEHMNQQFGAGNWQAITDYTQAPKIVGKLIEDAAKKVLKRGR